MLAENFKPLQQAQDQEEVFCISRQDSLSPVEIEGNHDQANFA